MKPSPFWKQLLLDKEEALAQRPDLIETFRTNVIGEKIDDVANALMMYPGRRIQCENSARNATRQAWNILAKFIDVDLMYLVEEKKNGRPIMANVGRHHATTSSVEFAYIATKLRQFLGDHTCEIGGGYGGLARALLGAHHHSYTLVDFPVIQHVQQYYLAGEDGEVDGRIKYLDPGEPLPEADLYINMRSMFEMTLEQIEWYLSEMTGPAHFFSMNRDKETLMEDWPIPPDWYVVNEQSHPMRSSFKMTVWYIP